MEWFWFGVVPVAFLFVIVVSLAVHARRKNPLAIVAAAQKSFQTQRPRLEKLFFEIAAASGKPRGLRWTKCEWNDLIAWARDKVTGQLLALVGVTISFEAIEGGPMEGVEAVANLRNATAVFYYDAAWHTTGRVAFNLNPDEVIEHFKEGYERVELPEQAIKARNLDHDTPAT